MALQVEWPWDFMAKGLDFGLGCWRLHPVPGRRLQAMYFIGCYSGIKIEFFGLVS